jgi:hypothetical protein
MVELAALTRAREIRQACQASSRRATLDFQKACSDASSLGVWLDEGENILRISRQWGGPVLGLASLFFGGKKASVAPLGWVGKSFAVLRLIQEGRKVWLRRKS